mmetsp:Transcript_1280/g.3094  ORF Transcript_1280/g.3094 Transcript_1280/m.3094 type:complete len:450 (-) Transcript_1280:111-1460(-)
MFSTTQQIILVLTAGVSALLSMIGSTAILTLIIKDFRNKFGQVKFRFLFGLSLGDFLNSIAYLFWSLPWPSDTPDVWGAMGNDTTCSVQGFLLQFCMIGTFYNGALGHYYYKSICKQTTDDGYAGYELVWHIVAISIPCFSGLVSVAMESYNYSYAMGCFFAPHPIECAYNDDIECIRGKNAVIWGWVFVGFPCMIILTILGFCMWKIKEEVASVVEQVQQEQLRLKKERRKQTGAQQEQLSGGEKTTLPSSTTATPLSKRIGMDGSVVSEEFRTQQSSSSAPPSNQSDASSPHRISKSQTASLSSSLSIDGNDKKAANISTNQMMKDTTTSEEEEDENSVIAMEYHINEAARQAYWYIGVYVATRFFGYIVASMDLLKMRQPFLLVWIFILTWPSQGLGNFLVFIRPVVAGVRNHRPELSYVAALHVSLFRYEQTIEDVTGDSVSLPS